MLSLCYYYSVVSLSLFTVTVYAHSLKECRDAIANERFIVAMSACQEAADAITNKKEKSEALMLAAEAAFATGKTLQAMRGYKEALEVDASNSKALYGLADSAYKLGDYVQARKAASKFTIKEKKKNVLVKCIYSRLLEAKAAQLMSKKKYRQAKNIYAELVRKSPDSSRHLSLLADCLLYLNEYQLALDVLKKEAALAGDSSNSYFMMGKVFLVQGNLDAAKKFINGAVRDNPDLRPAMALRSKIKAVEKLIDEANTKMLITAAIQTLEELQSELSVVKEDEKYYDSRFPNLLKQAFSGPIETSLCLKKSRRKDTSALAVCRSALINAREEDKKAVKMAIVELLLVDNESIEEAVKEAQSLQEQYPRDQDVQKLVKKVNEAHKKSKVKDYYAILGIDKSASEKDIKKAYKRLSIKWHPDKHSANPGPAEMKMKDINKAYEVLGNPESRRKYDQFGYDPEDPEAQQQHHGGFDFGGFGGGGGPFEFVFTDGQGRQWRQNAGGHRQQHQYHHYHQQQGQRQKQRQQQQWRWEDL